MEGIWENNYWGEFMGEKNVMGSSVVIVNLRVWMIYVNEL